MTPRLQVVTGEKAAILARVASRAFKAVGLGEPTCDRMSAHLQVAERDIEVRYSSATDNEGTEYIIYVVTDEWACVVRKQVARHEQRQHGRRGRLVFADADEIHEVAFQGDWAKCEADAVLVALG